MDNQLFCSSCGRKYYAGKGYRHSKKCKLNVKELAGYYCPYVPDFKKVIDNKS